jgi:hypothetical protein
MKIELIKLNVILLKFVLNLLFLYNRIVFNMLLKKLVININLLKRYNFYRIFQ